MPTDNPRLSFMVTHEMKDRITDYQFDHKCKNTSQALLELIQRGLEIIQDSGNSKVDPEAQQVAINEIRTELTSDEITLLNCFRSLNDEGQRSLLLQAHMHAQNEDFLKDTARKMA